MAGRAALLRVEMLKQKTILAASIPTTTFRKWKKKHLKGFSDVSAQKTRTNLTFGSDMI